MEEKQKVNDIHNRRSSHKKKEKEEEAIH